MPRTKSKKPAPDPTPAPPGAGAPDWADAFLAHLRHTANVRASCAAAGVTSWAAYERKGTDEAFAARWTEAVDDAIDALEAVAFERAKATSNALLIFLLKSHRPAVYGDKVEVTGANRLVIEEEVVRANDQANRPAPPRAT